MLTPWLPAGELQLTIVSSLAFRYFTFTGSAMAFIAG
jgi:hypothetical protein